MLGILIVIAIGGLVEIMPLFYLKNTIEKVDSIRPYSPLELAGRNIYVREGCYNCHSQMIRPLRDEVERYGHYSLAAESMFDRPFQWGSKRTGPDLARVGGKYSDDWHREHLQRSEIGRAGHRDAGLSVAGRDRARLRAHRRGLEGAGHARRAVQRGDDRQRAGRRADAGRRRCAGGRRAASSAIPRHRRATSTAIPASVTEADALIAYLQMLGTLVDFKLYNDKANIR